MTIKMNTECPTCGDDNVFLRTACTACGQGTCSECDGRIWDENRRHMPYCDDCADTWWQCEDCGDWWDSMTYRRSDYADTTAYCAGCRANDDRWTPAKHNTLI